MIVLPASALGGRVLSAGERGLVLALGEALFPPGNPLGVSAADVDIAGLVDELIGDFLDPVAAPVFRYLLRGLDAGTFASRGAAFGALPLAARREMLDTWADNAVLPRRLAYDTFKTVVGMAFFNDARAKAAVGWTVECQGEAA